MMHAKSMGACLFKPQTFKVSWLCNSKCIPVHIFMRETRALSFFLSLDSCTLVALVNLSMSILRDKNSPHGCPHTGGGHCAGTLITRQALSVGACIHKHSHSVPMWWEEDASPFLFSPDVLGSCCFYDPYRWIKWGVKISGFFFFFFSTTAPSCRNVYWVRDEKKGDGVLHMFWGPCMGISMYM